MSFNYPDFLGAGTTRTRQNSLAPNQGLGLDPRSPVFSQSLPPSDPPNNQNNPSNMNPNNVNPNNVNPNNMNPNNVNPNNVNPNNVNPNNVNNVNPNNMSNNVNPNNMSNNVNPSNINVPLNALNMPVSTLPVPLDPNAQNSHVGAYGLNHFSLNNLLSDNLLKLQKQDTSGPNPKVNASAFDPSNYDPTTYDSAYDSASYDPNSLAPFNPSFSLEYAYNPSQSPHNLHTPLSSLHNSNLHKSPFGRLGADSFHLPRELQGGIGNISSRRPSYAAESFTRNSPGSPGPKYGPSSSSQKHSLATIAAANNYGLKSKKEFGGLGQLADSLDGLSLNANFSDFQARRPSQLAEYQPQSTHSPSSQDYGSYTMAPEPVSTLKKQPAPFEQSMKLENGLILRDQYILASVELKSLFLQASRYFQDVELSKTIVGNLHTLLASPVVGKLIHFIKNANNLTFNHKMLCLVINKNGKLDLLSYPSNSNIYLQNDDLVIVDGDRGKDLVMILEPLVQLDMAILFNFLKKIEHLKSLTILDPNSASSSVKNNHLGGIHSTTMDAAKILANHHLSNEDNEFIISLPTKQVLRFATPKEVQRLGAKFLEEKKAFLTCHNKIKELKLENDLNLINVEYQYDFKKLIFYYFAGFKRIDFRGLIKELFKIYKTRIWLCAVLPSDSPELYTCLPKTSKAKASKKATDGIPPEYQLGNEQVVKFSLESFERIPQPNYFHSKNMANLVQNLMADVKGHFYGFGIKTPPGGSEPERRNSHSIVPSFDPFGDDRTLE